MGTGSEGHFGLAASSKKTAVLLLISLTFFMEALSVCVPIRITGQLVRCNPDRHTCITSLIRNLGIKSKTAFFEPVQPQDQNDPLTPSPWSIMQSVQAIL